MQRNEIFFVTSDEETLQVTSVFCPKSRPLFKTELPEADIFEVGSESWKQSTAAPVVLLPPMLYIICGQTCFFDHLRLLGSLCSEVLIASSELVG